MTAPMECGDVSPLCPASLDSPAARARGCASKAATRRCTPRWILFIALTVGAFASERPPVEPFPTGKPRMVSGQAMRRIHEQIQTPHKHGVVLKGVEGELLDCPNVFRHGGRWYMLFAANKDNVGYETHLAFSDDLLKWERLGPILPFAQQGWDAWQAAGGLALYDTRWDDATHELGTHEDVTG